MLSTVYMVLAHFQIAIVRFKVYVQKRKLEYFKLQVIQGMKRLVNYSRNWGITQHSNAEFSLFSTKLKAHFPAQNSSQPALRSELNLMKFNLLINWSHNLLLNRIWGLIESNQMLVNSSGTFFFFFTPIDSYWYLAVSWMVYYSNFFMHRYQSSWIVFRSGISMKRIWISSIIDW